MTKNELAKRASGGELVHAILVTNPVLIPDDAPAEVKCAWIRFYNQGRKDALIIKTWLDSKDPEVKTQA